MTKTDPKIKPIITEKVTNLKRSNNILITLLLTINPMTIPAPIIIKIGILKCSKAVVAVSYFPSNSKINEPLIPGNNMAILPAQPDKNKPIEFDAVNVVIGDESIGLSNANDARAAPTINTII